MTYAITCICGEKVTVEAPNREEAVEKMISAMDEHVAASEHPEVPKNLSREQKVGMVEGQMKEE